MHKSVCARLRKTYKIQPSYVHLRRQCSVVRQVWFALEQFKITATSCHGYENQRQPRHFRYNPNAAILALRYASSSPNFRLSMASGPTPPSNPPLSREAP